MVKEVLVNLDLMGNLDLMEHGVNGVYLVKEGKMDKEQRDAQEVGKH